MNKNCFMCGARIEKEISYYKDGKSVCSQACAAADIKDAKMNTKHTPGQNAEHDKPCNDHAGKTYAECGHTPGPWMCGGIFVMDNEKIIAVVDTCETAPKIRRIKAPKLNEGYANARLIASAPELLEALKDMHDKVSMHSGTRGNMKLAHEKGSCYLCNLIKKADPTWQTLNKDNSLISKAIAKADGK